MTRVCFVCTSRSSSPNFQLNTAAGRVPTGTEKALDQGFPAVATFPLGGVATALSDWWF